MAHSDESPLEPFAAAETRYRELLLERQGGRLDARAFRAAVRELAVVDGEGREWVLGPEDANWYRLEAAGWLAAEPPRRLVCPQCHHRNLLRHSFCVECGALVRG